MAMEQVLGSLKAAIDTANRAAVEYDAAKAKVNETANQQSKMADSLAKREAELDKIQAILGPALDAKKLRDESIKAKAEAEAAMKELKIRADAFTEYAQKEEKRLDAQRRSQDLLETELTKKAENISQREINLERLVIEKVQKLFPGKK